jgi:hypothetical protein
VKKLLLAGMMLAFASSAYALPTEKEFDWTDYYICQSPSGATGLDIAISQEQNAAKLIGDIHKGLLEFDKLDFEKHNRTDATFRYMGMEYECTNLGEANKEAEEDPNSKFARPYNPPTMADAPNWLKRPQPKTQKHGHE